MQRSFFGSAVQLSLAVLCLGVSAAVSASAQENLEKQPVFLFCPHDDQHNAWSLYVLVDKNEPSKPLALGLEALVGKNSRVMPYESVLKAQKDASTPRQLIEQLDAKDFGKKPLQVREQNMLTINVDSSAEGLLKLTLDARVGLDERFIVGGPEQGRRDVELKYSSVYQRWQSKATSLEMADGRNAVHRFALPLTGIVFVLGNMGISRIVAVDDMGSPSVLMDR